MRNVPSFRVEYMAVGPSGKASGRVIRKAFVVRADAAWQAVLLCEQDDPDFIDATLVERFCGGGAA